MNSIALRAVLIAFEAAGKIPHSLRLTTKEKSAKMAAQYINWSDYLQQYVSLRVAG